VTRPQLREVLMRERNAASGILFFESLFLEEVRMLCDRVFIISAGRLVARRHPGRTLPPNRRGLARGSFREGDAMMKPR